MYQSSSTGLNRLFLRRCKQIAELATSQDEGDMLDLSAWLRQILLDRNGLANDVKPKKIKLTFHVGQPSQPNDQDTQVYFLGDGIDPKTCHPGGRLPIRLSFNGYINHVVMYVQQSPVSIGNLIRYAANTAGGVHYDSSLENQNKELRRDNRDKKLHRLLRLVGQQCEIKGLPISILGLQAIARVTLQGLDPLIAFVERN